MCFLQLYIHSFIHSFRFSPDYSFGLSAQWSVHPFLHSCVYSFTKSLIGSSIHSFIFLFLSQHRVLACTFINSLIHWLNRSLVQHAPNILLYVFPHSFTHLFSRFLVHPFMCTLILFPYLFSQTFFHSFTSSPDPFILLFMFSIQMSTHAVFTHSQSLPAHSYVHSFILPSFTLNACLLISNFNSCSYSTLNPYTCLLIHSLISLVHLILFTVYRI